MDNLLEISKRNMKKAYSIIKELSIEENWNSVNAKANLVGSLRTKLMMSNLDIDFHIYSEKFNIPDSFKAVSKISDNNRIKEIIYKNLMDEEDKCLEWHLYYIDDENNKWQIDLIHIMNESPYVGKFERVADKINKIMTDDMRKDILSIKWNGIQRGLKMPGIEVYKAVIEDGIKNIDDYLIWKKRQPDEYIILWEPNIDE